MSEATVLYHKWCEPNVDFFNRIDAFGGWPVGMKYVSFEHEEGRFCKFGNEYLHTGWYTTICDSDEYYLWKLSADARKKLKEELRRELLTQLANMKVTQ